MQTIEPSKNNLFCREEESEASTRGFVVTQNSYDKPMIAEVIAIGKNIKDYKKTDRIVYKQYATTEVTLDDTKYFLINVEDVLGKIV